MLIGAHTGRRGSAAALLTLVLQLLFMGLAPAADARASAAEAGPYSVVHMEKPGAHHHVHDPAHCIFCLSLQAGAVPVPVHRALDAGPPRRLRLRGERPTSLAPLPPTSPSARAPPVR